MILAGNIFITRGSNARAVRSVEAAGERMKKEGLTLWIYPEGTRHMSESPDLLPFKKGGFHLAINAKIPIVPIVVENYWRIYHKGVFDTGVIKVKGKETTMFLKTDHEFFFFFFFLPVLPPIPTTSMTSADVQDFATHVRELMLEALCGMASKPPVTRVVNEKVSTDKITKQEEEPSPSLESVMSVVSPSESMGVIPSPVEAALSSVGSTSSLASSSVSVGQRSGRGYGTETEEDEEMVLVGRPKV